MTPDHKKTGGGSRAGVPNKNTAEIKDMILQALSESGGVEYLKMQAVKQPVAFMGLIGRVLPTQVNHSGKIGLDGMTNEQLQARLASVEEAIEAARAGHKE